MRQLWRTGWMHNRVRMITASFLIKHLLVDWREGEQWFWDTLVDADAASNAANWQWVAGSGADASPYFRIFNPILQGKKFDPDGAYVRLYVPELDGLPDKLIHEPWLAREDGFSKALAGNAASYPAPAVDHRKARRRALQEYEDMKNAWFRGAHSETKASFRAWGRGRDTCAAHRRPNGPAALGCRLATKGDTTCLNLQRWKRSSGRN